ncbi:MAG TPA: hypothetical protein VLK84_03880 [Longimicrobium sp.]|nr:hypothetical protein [Longimicrobium sp.]
MNDQKHINEFNHVPPHGEYDVSPGLAGTAVLEREDGETHAPYAQDKSGMDDQRHIRELKHVTRHDKYDVSFHPAFASSCVIEGKNGEKHTLYEQDRSTPVDCSNGHPKKHVIRLKGKNGSTRDITVTIDDPNHQLAGLRLSLYDEARDPMVATKFDATESFTVMNDAFTCPPHCQKEPPTGT